MMNRPSFRALQEGAKTRQLSPFSAKFGDDSYRTSPCFVCMRGRSRPVEVSL